MTQPTASTTEYRDFLATDGRIVVQARIDRHWDGTSIRITHSDTLGRQYPTGRDAELDTYLTELAKLAAAPGATLRLIEDAVSALTSAAAVFDDAEQDLIARINSTIDAAEQPYRTQREQLPSIAADVDTSSYYAERQQARQAANQRRDFSKTRVHRKPPTPAELDRIRKHRDGIVTLLPGQPWTLLQAIEARGYGTGVRENPLRPKLAYVRLNGRGLAVAGQQEVKAA